MKLAQARRFALSLPGVTEEPHFEYTSFRVRGKIFATAPPAGGHLHVFVGQEERDIALALSPGFLESLAWGGRVVGLRVSLAAAKPRIVTGLLAKAWSGKAPKSLLRETARSPRPVRPRARG